MNRFNLTFSGEIQQGEKPDAVKLRFAKKFAIDDPDRLDRFFSGQEVILRRNLDRKDAAQCFQEMRQIGVVVELVKVSAEEAAAAVAGTVNETNDQPLVKKRRGLLRRDGVADSDKPAPRKDASPTPRKRRKKKTADNTANTTANSEAAAAAAAQESDAQLAHERAAREDADARRQQAEREAEQLRAEMDAAVREREAAEQARLEAERAAQEQAAEQSKLESERAAWEKAEHRAEALRRDQQAQHSEQEEQRKALQEQEASRLNVEREARERAEQEREQAQEEKQRAEEALRAAEEAAQRRLEEELARRKAEEEAAEAAARKREETARKAEAAAREAAAQEKARAEEARRRSEAEAARQQAEQEREARRESEKIKQLAEKERQRAEEEQQRAEELTRQNVALEAERREATEKAASLEAALQANAEHARQEAEQQKARAEKRLSREKERMAKEEARLARSAATREARLEKERREAEARAAKREAALTEKARQAEERLKETQASERQAREAAKHAQAEAREQLILEEQERAMEEQAVDRAATALTGKVGLGPARASTRTSLEVPQRSGSDTGQSTRKRQPGEPNFYSLKPFRNTKVVRERAAQAGSAARRLASVGALAVAALAALTGAFLNYSPAPAVGNVSGVAVTPAGGPVLLAGKQLFLHDRAGKPEAELALAELGVARLSPPLAFEPEGTLLALGSLEAGGATQLLRCDLTEGTCARLPGLPASVEVVAYTSNPVNGELFLLDARGGALLKTNTSGEVRARAELALPEQPALRLHAGLLLLNSGTGPGVSVLRYDNTAFGEQLDEIMLVPPAAAAAEHSRVGDFLFSAGNWWVTLYNPDNGSAGLYRFDSRWNYLEQAALGHPSLPLVLTNWGDKTLVNDGRGITLGRFNSSGGVEVPLTSAPLEALADNSRLRNGLLDSAWRTGLVALALLALLAFAGAYLQQLRHLVYRATNERGAEPVDDLQDDVEWINPAQGREKTLRTRLISYAGLALALLLIAVGQRVGALHLAALLLFLLGPGIALAIVARSSAGHIGISADRLLLVEPAGTYHLGGGANLLYRGNLVFIDDVALYTGSRLLPAFNEEDIADRVEPLVGGGVRIDVRTTLTRLLQSQHPLARGITIVAASTFGALALLVAGGIF